MRGRDLQIPGINSGMFLLPAASTSKFIRDWHDILRMVKLHNHAGNKII
jgi:hypothetical protein